MRNLLRNHCLLCLFAVSPPFWMPAVLSEKALAQPVGLPFADPAKMLEQMFGEDSDEDRQALEKIEVTVEEERQWGGQLVQADLARLKESDIRVETAGRNVDYLQSLVATVQPFMRNTSRYKTIRVLFARSPRVDARSYPGGTLIFFEGLLDTVDNEAALVGIVGHELSHLDRGHQLLPIRRMKLMEKSFSFPSNPTELLSAQQGMAKLWARPFRPEDERDADRDGVAWSYAAGYDPRELARLFEKLQKSSQNVSPPAGMQELPWANFFKSHPYHEERREAILKQWNQFPKKKGQTKSLFIGRENLLNRFSRKQAEK